MNMNMSLNLNLNLNRHLNLRERQYQSERQCEHEYEEEDVLIICEILEHVFRVGAAGLARTILLARLSCPVVLSHQSCSGCHVLTIFSLFYLV
jgi:hypothetical protein